MKCKLLRVFVALFIMVGLAGGVSQIARSQEKKPAVEKVTEVGKETVKEKGEGPVIKTFADQFVIRTIEQKTGSSILARGIQTGIVIIIGYLLIYLLRSIINRKVKDLKTKHTLRKNVVYLVTALMLLFIFFVWVERLSSFTIFLGVASAGVALALQEALLCVAGFFLIKMRHPFEVGDRVELGGVKGDVIDIRLFQTSILEINNWVVADQSTGRIVNIPNSAVFKKENYNYSRGFEFIWNEIKILVTFESDYKRAEEIMLRHGNEEAEGMEDVVKKKIDSMTKQYMIYYDKLTPIVYTDIKDSGVELSLRYLTEAKKRRATQDMLCRHILDDFAIEPNVNFAYPTYRIVK